MQNGWISVYRSLQNHWIWDDKPYSKGQAWITMLMMANHEDKKLMYDGNIIFVKRGSFITSILKLSQKFGWDRKKTTRFIDALEMEKSVITNRTTHGTTVTIVNYEKYQSFGTRVDTDNVSIEGQPKDINNNVNNENNIINNINSETKQINKKSSTKKSEATRHKYGEYNNVLLSDEQLQKLQSEFPFDWETRINNLSCYMQSSGKSYKDHLATIRVWARKNKQTGNGDTINGKEDTTYESESSVRLWQ